VSEEGLEEVLLFHPAGGSIGAFALSRCASSYAAAVQPIKRLLEAVLQQGASTIGEAVLRAKRDVIKSHPSDDTRYGPAVLFTLLADPALTLPPGLAAHVIPYTNSRSAERWEGMLRCFPNPSSGSVRIELSLPSGWQGSALLLVYDILGRRIAPPLFLDSVPRAYELVPGSVGTGETLLPAGCYIVALEAGDRVYAHKVAVLSSWSKIAVTVRRETW